MMLWFLVMTSWKVMAIYSMDLHEWIDYYKTHAEERCYDLQAFGPHLEWPQEEQTVSIALLWNNSLEHAAAALLRTTLVFAGYNRGLIQLYHRHYTVPADESDHILTVEVPVGDELQLQVLASLRMEYSEECLAAVSQLYLITTVIDTKNFDECNFDFSQLNTFIHVEVYILNNYTCVAMKIKEHALESLLQPCFMEDDHSNMTELIQNSNNSFLLLDIYEDSDVYQKWVGTLSHISIKPDYYAIREKRKQKEYKTASNITNAISTESTTRTVLLKFADDNHIGEEVPETFIKFMPEVWDLIRILFEYSFSKQSNNGNEKMMNFVACRWVKDYYSFNFYKISKWQKSAVLTAARSRLAVIICESEAEDLKEYLYMMKVLADYKDIDVSTLFNNKTYIIQTFFIDCSNAGWFDAKLEIWMANNVVSVSVPNRVIAVLLPNEIAYRVAPLATKFHLKLLTYDIRTHSLYSASFHPYTDIVSSTAGSAEHLILALRRLLANCGWRRVAVISEQTQLAEAVSAALHSPNTLLTVRELKIDEFLVLDVTDFLLEMLNAQARVFIINAGAVMAANVLTVALELGLIQEKGFVWIVREYHVTDNATSKTMPYVVSFFWRGEKQNGSDDFGQTKVRVGYTSEAKEMTDEVVIRLKLEERWQGRPWPLYAAPLLDAFFTILHLKEFTGVLEVSEIWDDLYNYPIPGIIQNLTYDKNSVKSPLIFVEQWVSEPRPHLLATWRGGEWREEGETCPATDAPPDDGTTYCLMPTGDSFQPTCGDPVWIPSIVLVAVFAILIIIYCSRKAYLAHNLRIRTEYAKRMLTRRERVFEALTEHLVERSELQLLQELGSGRFGRVHHGMLREPGSKCRNVVVACKTLREDASSTEEGEFLREACMLASLKHEHIIRFMGICIVDGPPMLLMEHAFFGDLLHYLQARRHLAVAPTNTETTNQLEIDEKAHVSPKAITKLAHEAAMALAYLAERDIVHRDFRASNCLVDERRSLKLADFGLARTTGIVDGEYQMCRRGVVPVLWMAPESLARGVFSPASDVWSLGVLVFELVTLGRRPYGVQPPELVMRHVVAGGRPLLPWDASAQTRAVTRACWRREPEARPTASRLATWLSAHHRALRPALVDDLVDVEQLINVVDFDEPGLSPPDTSSLEETITKQT